MVESPHPRSPTRSIRSDVVRSFTTSSETSASERIAASRAARALRRAPREADDSPAGETLEGEPSHATSTDALEGLATAEGTVTGGETATSSTSAVPRLRVQPTSDRSYSPSVPSSPAKSKKSTSASSHMSPTSLVRDDSSTEVSPVKGSKVKSLTRHSRQFPRAASTGNAASSGPSTPPPRSPSPSPPSSISLAGGLMERLKAQRAARAAQGAIAPDASDFSPTRAFETSSSRSMSVLGEDLMEAPAVLQATVTTFDNARPSSVPYEKLDMPPGSVAERPASLLERPSTLYGRVGEEIEFEFHQLSDVPCVYSRRLGLGMRCSLLTVIALAGSKQSAALCRRGKRTSTHLGQPQRRPCRRTSFQHGSSLLRVRSNPLPLRTTPRRPLSDGTAPCHLVLIAPTRSLSSRARPARPRLRRLQTSSSTARFGDSMRQHT